MKTSKRQFSAEKLAAVAKILKIIAHPIKLEIMELLEAEEPLNVSALHERLSMDCELSMLSHHLAKMKDNGVLSSQKRGKQVYYQLADRQILRIFDCMEKCDFL